MAGEHVTLWILKDDRPGGSVSVGVVAGRGYKKAVDRNLAKRRTRGCIIERKQKLKPGYRYLFECRKSAGIVSYQYLVADVEKLISEVKVERKDKEKGKSSSNDTFKDIQGGNITNDKT